MTEILLAINVALTAYLAYRDYQRRTRHVSLDKVIDGLAGRLLDGWASDLRALGRPSVYEFSRKQYLQLCTDYGFPIAATDAVCADVWAVIQKAQDAQPERDGKGFALYG